VTETVAIHPAGTVALLRDGELGIETLLLRRSDKLAFAASSWVFPGGRLEPDDVAAGEGDEERAARFAAARESLEECALRPDRDNMPLLSRWTTPEGHSRRFSTYIFAAPLAHAGEVAVDGGEIDAYRWLPTVEALRLHRGGELNVLPPTMITLRLLSGYADVDSFLHAAHRSSVPEIFPVLCKTPDGLVSLYAGDAGYEAADPSQPGARHRSVMLEDHWVYHYEQVDSGHPPLVPLEGMQS